LLTKAPKEGFHSKFLKVLDEGVATGKAALAQVKLPFRVRGAWI
jgi:hypothetical protein